MPDISSIVLKSCPKPSNARAQNCENAPQKKKRALPSGDDTLSCSFRLRGDEITFIESLPGDSLTEKLRRLLTWGRGIGNGDQTATAKKSMFDSLRKKHGIDGPKTADTASSADVIYALVTRIEKLEAAQKQRAGS